MMLSAAAMVVLFQDAVAAEQHDIHLLTIFVGIAAVGLVVQSIALAVAASFGAKLLKKVDDIADHVDQKVSPILSKTNALMDELTPKMRTISENVEQVSYTVRAKADEIAATVTEINRTVQEVNVTVQDANLRTRGQLARVDNMVTDALNTTHEVSHSIQEGIRKPVRKVAAIIEGLKAGLETLAAKSPFAKRPPQSPYDF